MTRSGAKAPPAEPPSRSVPSAWEKVWEVTETVQDGDCFFHAWSLALEEAARAPSFALPRQARTARHRDQAEVRGAVCAFMTKLADRVRQGQELEHWERQAFEDLAMQGCADGGAGAFTCQCGWAAAMNALPDQLQASARATDLAQAEALGRHAERMAVRGVHSAPIEMVAACALFGARCSVAVATTNVDGADGMARGRTQLNFGAAHAPVHVVLQHLEKADGQQNVVGHYKLLTPRAGLSENGVEEALEAGRSAAAEAEWAPPDLMAEFEPLLKRGDGGRGARRRGGKGDGRAAAGSRAGTRRGRRGKGEASKNASAEEDGGEWEEEMEGGGGGEGGGEEDGTEDRAWGLPRADAPVDRTRMEPQDPATRAKGVAIEDGAWFAVDALSVDECCVAPFRMLENVPSYLLQQWADAYACVTCQVKMELEAGDDLKLETALKWRLILPQLVLRTAPKDMPQPRDYVSKRFRLFAEGDWVELLRWWAADLEAIAKENQRMPTPDVLPHVKRLARKGLLSRATQHLTSTGTGDPASQAVRDQMRRKFPKRVVGIPAKYDGVVGDGIELDLCEALRRLKPMAGVGPDGFRNEYLTALVRAPDRKAAIHACNWFGTVWTSGKLPSWFYKAGMGGRVAPLVKDGAPMPERGEPQARTRSSAPEVVPDCRPVVVGNAERRVHTSQTMRQFKDKFRQILWPQQAAVGVKSGLNFVTTAIRTALQQNPSFICVKVDLSNAFNAVTRAALLAAIDRHELLRPLLSLYSATLAPAAKIWMRGAGGELEEMDWTCEDGSHQGCASSGAAFCLAIHPSILVADAALTRTSGFARFFADDGYLCGEPNAVLAALAVFEEQVKEECGLDLNRNKTEWYGATAATADGARSTMEGEGLKEGVGEGDGGGRGIIVTGIPVGDAAYEEDYAKRRTERALSKTTKIVDKLCPQELQIASVLVQYCALPLVDYLAGSLPAHVVREALQAFDDGLLERIAPRIMPGEIYDEPLLMRRLRLPARMEGGAIRARGGWLADAAYAATQLRVLPEMVDHEAPKGHQGSADGMEVGFLHDHFAGILGTEEENVTGQYQHMCEGDTELGRDFVRAWEALREAAGHPTSTTNALSDPPSSAGYHLVSGSELAAASEHEPEEGDEAKAKEQKQLTMAVEAVTSLKLREAMAALDPGTQEEPNMLRASFFSVGSSSRHWIYTPPYKGCDLTSAEMRIIIDRYFGVTCKICEPHVGKPVRGETAGPKGVTLDKYGITLANANVGGDRWRRRHDAVLAVIVAELASACQDVQDNVYGLVETHFGDGSETALRRVRDWGNKKCAEGDRKRRRRQGVVPDLLLENAVNHLASIVSTRTLFELKQINFLPQYVQVGISGKPRHAVETRASTVHKEYVRKLHEVDKIAGTNCPGSRLRSGKCSYGNDTTHTQGGGEKYLADEFGTVQPLVFGHFGELNERFEGLLGSAARCIANLHHREHGWKSAKAGFPRAKAGVMRRVSMAVLKATARHTLRGLEIITPQAMHTHTARRAKSEAAREADFDEHRWDVRAFGCNGHDGRTR